MTTKKSETDKPEKSEKQSGSDKQSGSEKRSGSEQPGVDPRGKHNQIEERKRRRTEATTVDGSESFPPPGMDLPDGGVVPMEEDPNAPATKE